MSVVVSGKEPHERRYTYIRKLPHRTGVYWSQNECVDGDRVFVAHSHCTGPEQGQGQGTGSAQ